MSRPSTRDLVLAFKAENPDASGRKIAREIHRRPDDVYAVLREHDSRDADVAPRELEAPGKRVPSSDGAFDVPGLRWTRTSLEFTDTRITYDDCLKVAWALGRTFDMTKWAIADLVNFSERRWGETYAQIAEATGRSPQGLMNITSVGRRVPQEIRRPELSFSHHEVVASLDRDEQVAWLDRAEEDRLTVEELRSYIRATRHEPNEPSLGASAPLPVIEALVAVEPTRTTSVETNAGDDGEGRQRVALVMLLVAARIFKEAMW